MLDAKLLRTDLEKVQQQLRRRGFEFDATAYQALEDQRRGLQSKTQELQAERNRVSKMIGQAKAKGEDVAPVMQQVAGLGDELKQNEHNLNEVLAQLEILQAGIPNLLHESVPDGNSEADNVEERRWGEPRQFDFEAKDHVSLGENLAMMNFEQSAKLSGARFVVLHAGLARLQRALAQFMLDLHLKEHGYQEVYVPFLVKDTALFGSGQLPKFKQDLFETTSEHGLYCIPTAEVPVANLVADEVLDVKTLPRKYVTQTPCFRSEAGSYGKDTRGMFRVHQFEKVEMVQLVCPEDSYQALEEITSHAERVLQLLELPYRVMSLCSKDVGFSAAKTYDLEVWLPGQNDYREISSCSNCEDFQARRMKARYRHPDTGKTEYIHTLNGSGLAIGRTLIAVMENYQTKEGRIKVPEILQSYVGSDII
ncbi:MAG: serine--tRNA ligase [Gammaproteobacteria bacterium]|nr:serine--tRNA ligase [Gammaproteobacteria bacterium]MCH9744461.1 serine--tRNA ligase [Gammaproteobacteria bacterium]